MDASFLGCLDQENLEEESVGVDGEGRGRPVAPQSVRRSPGPGPWSRECPWWRGCGPWRRPRRDRGRSTGGRDTAHVRAMSASHAAAPSCARGPLTSHPSPRWGGSGRWALGLQRGRCGTRSMRDTARGAAGGPATAPGTGWVTQGNSTREQTAPHLSRAPFHRPPLVPLPEPAEKQHGHRLAHGEHPVPPRRARVHQRPPRLGRAA